MAIAVCPSCDSQSVSWQSSHYICQECKMMSFKDICYFCNSKNLVFHKSQAECSECGWNGDPFDLLEVEEDDPE